MNLDELRSVQAKERRKDSLQHLRDAFYDDVAGYVSDLRAARDRRADQVDNPFSDDDVRRMSDELETAEEVAEALYERRVGKVVKLASFAAADMSVETDGMTSPERALFDDLVARIRDNKSEVLATLAGEVPPAGDDEPVPDPEVGDEPEGASTSRADAAGAREADASVPSDPVDPAPPESDPGSDVLAGAMGGDPAGSGDDGSPDEPAELPDSHASTTDTEPGTASTDGGPTTVDPDPAPPGAPGVDGPEVDGSEPTATDPAPSGDSESSSTRDPATTTIDRETVRITRDVGEIFGVDEREYDLASEDVVTLPTANAEPLVERDAAERIE
ncbi:hypothetical protein DQW50_04240 [Halorubrum sp. 48-1-W]|uniref:DNA replication complex subunit Gins51 n=1 Tax=Halorubrum sp. 48-1-W TaxID=2249761 RepID=UPI000DCD03EA|nr:hypothetical protein [Halorubrum sp. 48-1-W]RAW46309.1 hypothetical protein DQW50_04240 [Halorubrum sp. 48-1-W]